MGWHFKECCSFVQKETLLTKHFLLHKAECRTTQNAADILCGIYNLTKQFYKLFVFKKNHQWSKQSVPAWRILICSLPVIKPVPAVTYQSRILSAPSHLPWQHLQRKHSNILPLTCILPEKHILPVCAWHYLLHPNQSCLWLP